MDMKILSRSVKYSIEDIIDQTSNDTTAAVGIPFLMVITKASRNVRFIPISAGTTAAEREAKTKPLLNEINTKAITMVDGNVPIIPPTFVPYFSAMTVINTTINADRAKGIIT
jgi:hypothetical protein